MTDLESSSHKRQDANTQGLRSLHVIAGLEVFHGGPSYSVPRLCEALACAGAQTTLLSVADTGEPSSERFVKGYLDRRFIWDYVHLPILRNLRSSGGLSDAIDESALGADVVHNHGLWLMPNVRAGWAATAAKKPLVVSPRGMLSQPALAHSYRKKLAFWRLLQGPVMRRAACIHATSEQEYQEIRAFGLTNPVAIIPNGIDLPAQIEPQSRDTASGHVVLSLGRIHPKKGLDRLIRAWARIEPIRPDWRLRIIGPNEVGHREELEALAAGLGLTRVAIEGAAYGGARQVAYRDADLFVLSTLNENFGLTVGEALASGLPVIATKGAPWSGLEVEGCGWWIDQGIDSLAATLASATDMLPDARKTMGRRGRQWIAREFSWARVARDMLDTYRWLKQRADVPTSLRLD